jgi:hypothetical protein
MPTISTYVDVDVALDDFDDGELVDELEHRGYQVFKEGRDAESFDRYDLQMLLELIDCQTRTIELDRVREKILGARYAKR